MMYKLILFTIIGISSMQANNLKNESSSYLRAHSKNPVNWYAWNQKTLDMAKKQNKMIFLSIGYSTCHWCHVMEEESFENEELAKLINKDYISIKIDREEMPDLDSYYQKVYQMFHSRGGGWPLSIILTPDLSPLFAATYIPLEAKYGQKGFKDILNFFTNLKETNPSAILNSKKEFNNIKSILNPKLKISKLDFDPIKRFVNNVKSSYDSTHHGIGNSPKFPHASMINTLLNIYLLKKDNTALEIAKSSLTKMSHSGIHDLIEGGFYRYSVDADFKIPHFEKMLYTNAELLQGYNKLYRITKNTYFLDISKKIVLQIKNRFYNNGLLQSASDADSLDDTNHLHEGYYFTYTYDEAYKSLLDNGFEKKEIPNILDYFDITINGNFENSLSNPHKKSTNIIDNEDKIIRIFKQLRKKKKYPFIDEKMQTSWNAMFITELFDINETLSFEILQNIIDTLIIKDELYHYQVSGYKIKTKGYLEDYSFLIETLIKAHQKSLNLKYLTLANKLYKKATELFFDKQWFISSTQNINASSSDNAYKSAVSMMIQNIFKLSILNNDREMYIQGKEMLSKLFLEFKKYPISSPSLLDAILMQDNLIIIKANKSNLQSHPINDIQHPYIMINEDKNLKNFNVCNHKICFANGDFNTIQKVIEK